jgi:hypothetical protein
MQASEERHLRGIRNLLREARVENSRVVAAAIGDHLSKLGKRTGGDRTVAEAADGIRDASLALLKSLHLGHDVVAAREAALAAVNPLEASLPLKSRAPAGQGRTAGARQPRRASKRTDNPQPALG